MIQADAREYLASLRGQPQFDLAVVDPPTFSNSKRMDDDWDVQQDHAELIAATLANMKPGGVVFFSTNSRRFKFDEAARRRRRVPRNHQAHHPRRLPQQAHPPLLADRQAISGRSTR